MMAGAGKEEAGASEPRVPSACLFPTESTAEARPVGAADKRRKTSAAEPPQTAGAGKKTEDATATATAEKEEESLWKEGEMLRLKEELWEAERLWFEMRGMAITGTITRNPAAVDEKKKSKKRKLVRVVWPNACVQDMIENPCMMPELSAREMAEYRSQFRQSYAMCKIINAKQRAYQRALIEHYGAFGYAYDEVEVIDDDEDEEEVKQAEGPLSAST